MKIPKPIQNLIESFEKLPGIGPKTAQRLTYYLLHVPQFELDSFAESLSNLKKNTFLCSICKNVAETDPCLICLDVNRDKSTVMAVEQPLDILAFEKTGKYKGLYHVLHGSINPLENIGPDELYIQDLIVRVSVRVRGTETDKDKDKEKGIREVIIATNPTMEGEATAMYITKELKKLTINHSTLTISRLGMGIPTGADLEYADEVTLNHALEGRREI